MARLPFRISPPPPLPLYQAVLANQARNLIRYLRTEDGVRVHDGAQVKDMAVAYYQNLLGTENAAVVPYSVEHIRQLHPFRCSAEMGSSLVVIPSDEEIISTLFRMPNGKAPGPDGFSKEFFVDAWSVVGADTVKAVKEFFVGGRLLKKFNSTAITLIPKTSGADTLSQFRPVSCCSTIYKVIARILKQRLKIIMPLVIQRNQVGFMEGRLLCENVLLASELVECFHRPATTTRGCLQIDLSKGYDNLDWRFLFNILQAFDLPAVFIGWIKECVCTTSYSLAFNGELIGFFHGKKGVRQGDPISSLLFLLAMDILAKTLDSGLVNQVFNPHPLCDAPLISHLSFADDILVFFDGSESSARGILCILDRFKLGSGLFINRSKTAIFTDGGDVAASRTLALALGLKQGDLPVRYLGVPLTSRKLSRQDYQPLLDKVKKRLNSYTARCLSYAGRLQLLKSVIFATISFWQSVFLLPNQCIRALEQLCNGFLWKGIIGSAKGAQVSWESVCTPVENGGLGLRNFTLWNKVHGLKLIWLLFSMNGSLWVSWVRLHLIGQRNFWDLDCSTAGSWIWKNICKLRPLARNYLICEVGSGITARFWHDNWTSHGPLIDVTGESGPQVTGLPYNAVVADALVQGDWWVSRSISRSPIIVLLKQCLPAPDLILSSEVDDCYRWKPGLLSPSDCFSASDTWRSLLSPAQEVEWHDSVWFKGRIPKHSFITWLCARDRLMTRDKLIRWGFQVPSSCLLCNAASETRQHLFFDCPYSSQVWSSFCVSAHLNPPSLFNSGLRWIKDPTRDKNIALILKLLYQASIYFLWRERNARLHNDTHRPASAIISEIHQVMRFRLTSLTKAQRNLPSTVPYTLSWRLVFNPP